MTQAHAFKLEDLSMTTLQAEQVKALLLSFLKNLEFNDEGISELECRSRDGFSAYSHNKGGFEAISYRDQYSAQMEGTGFVNCDATLDKYAEYNLESFLSDKGLDKDAVLTEAQYDALHEYSQGSDDTVLFGCDLMLTSEKSLNIRITVSCKDSPYHRQYDDLIEVDLTFKSISDLRTKLSNVLKRKDVKLFASNVVDGY